jgi:hypothetical protein
MEEPSNIVNKILEILTTFKNNFVHHLANNVKLISMIENPTDFPSEVNRLMNNIYMNHDLIKNFHLPSEIYIPSKNEFITIFHQY